MENAEKVAESQRQQERGGKNSLKMVVSILAGSEKLRLENIIVENGERARPDPVSCEKRGGVARRRA